MPQVDRDDVTLHYQDRGTGDTVLLIHGHTLDRRVWEPVAPRLVDRGCRVVCPDLRGHGLSSRPGQGYHWVHHAADIEAVLDAAGVQEAALVGFSLGGGVALELALTRPGRVSRMVLVAPVMPDRPFEAEFMDNLRQVARVTRSEGIRTAMLGPWLDSPLFARSVTSPGVRERVEAMVAEFPGAEYLATERDRVDREWRLPDRLAEIGARTLVLVGQCEMPGFRAFADEAATGIGGARLVEVPGAGHLLPLEAPELVAREILQHLGL